MTRAGFRRERLGPLADGVTVTLAELSANGAVRRLWERDHTLWSDDPTEISDRLGWLEVAAELVAAAEEVDGFVAGCVADGITDAVVMGMGGSSLFPEVIAASFPPADGAIRLHVLDSTDPAAVGHVAAHLDPDTTLFVASSKSGSTIETRSHLDFFWERDPRGDRFAVVTDPGSELGALARDRGFRHVFENRADIGGRYSALSFFGLVPTALAGVDWTALAGRAVALDAALRSDDPAVNAGLRLGAAMGAAVRAGRDKLTLLIDPSIEAFGRSIPMPVAIAPMAAHTLSDPEGEVATARAVRSRTSPSPHRRATAGSRCTSCTTSHTHGRWSSGLPMPATGSSY